MMKTIQMIIIDTSKVIKVIFLLLLFLASLYPPFEWNFEYTDFGSPYSKYKSSSDTPYSVKNSPIKTYDFLFGYNQKIFYSDLTKKTETFNRSIILSELIVEYILISLATGLVYLMMSKMKRNLQ